MLNVAATLAFLLTAFVIHSECSSHFGGHDEVHDEAHIKQHLEDKIDVSKMTEEQQRFYYFSMSDLNKDNFIDGTEILKALTHDHSGGTGMIECSVTRRKEIPSSTKESCPQST